MSENLENIWQEYQADSIGEGSVVVDLGSSESYFTDWAKGRGAIVDSYDARYGTAVGPSDGYCTVKGTGTGAHILPDTKGKTRMVSLKTILDKHDTVDFLKCDIEGGEYFIFNCDLSKIKRFGMEFHVWTLPDEPKPGLGSHPDPMPDKAVDSLLAKLRQTHVVTMNGRPDAGGYLYGELK